MKFKDVSDGEGKKAQRRRAVIGKAEREKWFKSNKL